MEVDDVDGMTMTSIRPAAAWVPSACGPLGVEGVRLQAPTGAVHGTGLPVAGPQCINGSGFPYAGSAAFAGVGTTDLTVSPPRGAPV